MDLLQEFGAPSESCVDLHDNQDARCLRYTDLFRNRQTPLVDYVVEQQVQALLYVVALHRWLRVRRGAGYDHGRDFGGVRYLFCRGLDRAQPARGVIAPHFDQALVEAVDALFGHAGAGA